MEFMDKNKVAYCGYKDVGMVDFRSSKNLWNNNIMHEGAVKSLALIN